MVSLRPFYTRVDLEADPGLTGSWRDKEGDVSFTFQEGEEKEYTLVVKEREGDQETSGEFDFVVHQRRRPHATGLGRPPGGADPWRRSATSRVEGVRGHPATSAEQRVDLTGLPRLPHDLQM